MPLRDHFRPPLSLRKSWQGFHGQWPATIVQGLNAKLPPEFEAEPRVQLGTAFEVDVATYEVLVYDVTRDRRLVAAMEIVSPRNKDRPESGRAFVHKCEALLHQDVCVAIVDLVTNRTMNLYQELAELFGVEWRAAARAALYAVSCRPLRHGERWRVEAWENELALAEPLPTLPLWLTDELFIPLELEASYEATCQALRIK